MRSRTQKQTVEYLEMYDSVPTSRKDLLPNCVLEKEPGIREKAGKGEEHGKHIDLNFPFILGLP